MADGVADEKPDVVLVEPHHVVEIATDVTRRSKERVEMDIADLRKHLGKEILLNSCGQAQFLIQAVHQEPQRLVAPPEHVELGVEALDFVLQLTQLIEHGHRTGERWRQGGPITLPIIANQPHRRPGMFISTTSADAEGSRCNRNEMTPP